MSLTKEIEIGKIEIINKWSVHVRTDTIIKDNGVEVSRSFHRHVLQPFTSVYATREENGEIVPDLDENGDLQWTHTATDISAEDAQVQAICNATWTNDVKNNFKTFKEAQEVT